MTFADGLAQLHLALAAGAAVVAAGVVVLGVVDAAGVVTADRSKRLLDRGILALLAVTAAAAIVGPLVLLVAGPPREWLHLVYAAAALAAAPVARAIAAARGSSRTGAWVAVGGLVTLAALLRLWGTGG
jgi:hypothetical protein